MEWDEDKFDKKILESLALEREIVFLNNRNKLSLENQKIIQTTDDDVGKYIAEIDFDDASYEWKMRHCCLAITAKGIRCKRKAKEELHGGYCSIHKTVYLSENIVLNK